VIACERERVFHGRTQAAEARQSPERDNRPVPWPSPCVDPASPAFFGFTLFGGVRHEAVDWYWTYNGDPIARYPDVWQDGIKVDGNLRDVIVPRPVPFPPPPGPWPTSVVYVARTVGTQFAPVSIGTLASLPLPPNPVTPDPGPVVAVTRDRPSVCGPRAGQPVGSADGYGPAPRRPPSTVAARRTYASADSRPPASGIFAPHVCGADQGVDNGSGVVLGSCQYCVEGECYGRGMAVAWRGIRA
jgi:hypothetical protein